MMEETKNWRTPPEAVPESEITQTLRADVVVIGLGYSGTMAARAAAESGASVIALEAREEKRASVFGGEIASLNSDFLRSRGVPEVDLVEFLNDWQMRTNNRSNPRLVMKFARNSGKNFDYMIDVLTQEEKDTIRIKYQNGPKHFEGEVGGLHFWVGTSIFNPDPGRRIVSTELMRRNRAKAAENGAQLIFGAKGCYLLKEGGRVTGVVAQKKEDGTYLKVLADKGVLLAAGDFSGNPEMVHDLCEELTTLADDGQVLKGAGWDGSGIRMGLWAGGRLTPGPCAVMGGNYFYPNGIVGNAAVLWLDDNMNRYCNEGFGGDMVYSALEGARLPGGKVTAVFDDDMLEHLSYQSIGHCAMDLGEPSETNIQSPILLKNRMEQAKAAGKEGLTMTGHGFAAGHSNKVTLYAADTWEELADDLALEGKKRENFLASVARYNTLCRAKRDEDFGKDPRLMLEYNKPPFYAFQKEMFVGNEFLATVDGLWTDDDQNVLDRAKQPIPGLYATGNCCGRRWGAQYSTSIAGLSIGFATTMGVEAGRHMAQL